MKPTATEARILRNEDGLLQEVFGQQRSGWCQELRAAFETDDDAFLGVLIKDAIRSYAEGLDDQPIAKPDAEHESRLMDRDNARAINAGRY